MSTNTPANKPATATPVAFNPDALPALRVAAGRIFSAGRELKNYGQTVERICRDAACAYGNTETKAAELAQLPGDVARMIANAEDVAAELPALRLLAGATSDTPPRNLHGLDLISTEAMLGELNRRMRGYGDFPGHITPVLILAVTPDDLVEYWECDDAGNTHPGSRVPSEEAWQKMRKTFEVWQDVGAYSELMSCLRETWIQADPESFQDETEESK